MNKLMLDTPCIVVDEAKLLQNIERMQQTANAAGISLRPHIKTHKTPEIAKLQLEAGAVGITSAKLGEAEVMAEQGVSPIVIAYPIVGAAKLERLMRLTERAAITVAVDSIEVARGIAEAAAAAGRTISVWVEVDPGYGRVGVQPGEALERLGAALAELPGVRVTGVLTFGGQSYDAADDDALRQVVHEEARIAREAAATLRRLGCPVEAVSIGSTPASRLAAAMEGATEMRPGTYVFGDLTQVKAGAISLADCALTVLATVISRPAPDRAVIDAGTKVFTMDGEQSPLGTGRGYVLDHPGIEVAWFNEEHGVLHLPPEEQGLQVGDKLQIIPVHCCAVVNMLDVIHLVRDTEVQRIWKIAARGKVN
ncbi:alanine racemase [Paenibacillus sp. GCM10027626]|uniref:alanine racemase n=1 Tax=Paenibacillus sp. GCM10027626 TaxID=3273411 RepID=UPI00362A2811